MADAIAVFARAPVPGQVKTRLAQGLGPELAATAYRMMLRDSLALARRAARSWGECEVVLCYTPRSALEPGPYSLDFWRGAGLPQSEGDLGMRMLDCMDQLRARGASKVIIIGSDSPDLPPARIGHALAALHRQHLELGGRNSLGGHCDIVLGPARDGGFYLIGTNRTPPSGLFDGVQWSGSKAYAQVVANAAGLGLKAVDVDKWGDVDTVQDLERLAKRALRYRCFLERAASTG